MWLEKALYSSRPALLYALFLCFDVFAQSYATSPDRTIEPHISELNLVGSTDRGRALASSAEVGTAVPTDSPVGSQWRA